MNVFDMLEQEHDKVKKSLQSVMRSMSSSDSDKLREICMDLERHMSVEEEVVYPRLRKIDEISDLIADGYEEHGEVKDVLKKIKRNDMDVESCEDELEKLRDLIDHHVREEENQVFPTARKTLSENEIDKLTEQASNAKEKFKPSIV